MTTAAPAAQEKAHQTTFRYDEWMDSRGVPVHRGYYVPDVRTAELAPWPARQAATAFIQLEGQQGVSEARITEIAPGESLPAYRLAIDEVVYVASGHGRASVEIGDTSTSFEWGPHALFLVPRHTERSFTNMRGDEPVRLLHYSYLPLAMSIMPDIELLVDGPQLGAASDLSRAFDEAKAVDGGSGLKWIGSGKSAYWYGNFFPDMGAWDQLIENTGRGAGGKVVSIQFAGSDMGCHMSVFAARTYKKAHRHGPGRVIVIPGGEGYSLMWQEGQEKIVVPWQEGSLVVPPDRWFHQHCNLGAEEARYLAFHPPLQFHGYADKVQDRARDQIEYTDEDPWVREHFESELAKRGLQSLIPERAYQDPTYDWKP
jgi:hypothetical protein